jgi:hypothetical protein
MLDQVPVPRVLCPFHYQDMPSDFDLFSSVQALAEDASLYNIPNELDVPNCSSSQVEDALNGALGWNTGAHVIYVFLTRTRTSGIVTNLANSPEAIVEDETWDPLRSLLKYSSSTRLCDRFLLFH